MSRSHPVNRFELAFFALTMMTMILDIYKDVGYHRHLKKTAQIGKHQWRNWEITTLWMR